MQDQFVIMLDCTIHHNKSQKIPLEFLRGFPFCAMCVIYMFFGYLYLIPYFGFVGFVFYLVGGWGLIILDTLVSDHFGKNVETLRINGFSDIVIIGTILCNQVSSQTLGFVIISICCKGISFFDSSTVQHLLQVSSILKIVINLAVTEVLFTVAHRYLHTDIAYLHHMHHCNKFSCWTTNLIFHPIDLSLEFSGPVASLVFFHVCVFKDPIVLYACFVVLQVWYALDHDEYLKLHHYQHHLAVDSVYTIYIRLKEETLVDKVKPLLLKKST